MYLSGWERVGIVGTDGVRGLSSRPGLECQKTGGECRSGPTQDPKGIANGNDSGLGASNEAGRGQVEIVDAGLGFGWFDKSRFEANGAKETTH